MMNTIKITPFVISDVFDYSVSAYVDSVKIFVLQNYFKSHILHSFAHYN